MTKNRGLITFVSALKECFPERFGHTSKTSRFSMHIVIQTYDFTPTPAADRDNRHYDREIAYIDSSAADLIYFAIRKKGIYEGNKTDGREGL